jgi:DNA primase catalytic core
MARVADAEIERLKAETSLPRLIEASGVKLEKRGRDFIGLCPFHAADTPSLIVSRDNNLWHCDGCGARGGVIEWAMKKNGVSFRHAVELLREGVAQVADEPVKRSTIRALQAPVALDADDQKLCNQVFDYYHATLKQSPEALAYLKKRGIEGDDVITTFRLGYANRTLGLRLPDKTRKEGRIIRERLERLGLYRDTGHEHFNGSLVVPVMNEQGDVRDAYGRKILNNLRAGTPLHLYLPGERRGVWNVKALAASNEIILCQSLIDAMTFWCAGYRNVTTAYGPDGLTGEIMEAFKTHGVARVLIAYGHGEAGKQGVENVAAQLMAAGIECWRIRSPKGMDANDYALKVQPAAKSLGVLIRKAEWLGNGKMPVRPKPEPELSHAPPEKSDGQGAYSPPSEIAAVDAPMSDPRTAEPPAPFLPASPVPPAPRCDLDAAVSDTELIMNFAARRWRVRGLPKNLAVGVLKVNIMVSEGDAFHVDTLDLYNARARGMFTEQAATELRAKEPEIKSELGRVLLRLEQQQDETIRKTLEIKPAHPAMADHERDAALALLKTPDLMERILADFEKCGVTGERVNKITAYLAATSRKLDHPLGIVVQSSSAAGKTSLMDAVLAFIPDEDKVRYSAMTGQSLYYLGAANLRHKVLAIAEEEGAQRVSYALKLLQSEGELTIASTGADANGNLITQEYRVEGPTALITTTTAIDVDEELMNRCLVLAVDEGREQTRAIHARQRAKRTLLGLRLKQERDDILALHKNAQRLLLPLAVVNPYADRLTFLDDRTRTRRDHEKYLTLIDAIALLHQHQRPVRTFTEGGRSMDYIEATASDILKATQLAHEVLGRSLDELPPQTRRLLRLIQDMVTERSRALACKQADIRFTRRELREHTGIGDTQLRLHLDRLVRLEYVLVHRGGRGQSFVYECFYDGSAGDSPHLSGLIDAAALQKALDDMPMTATSRGETAPFAGPSRGQSAPNAGGSRPNPLPETAGAATLPEDSGEPAPETRIQTGGGENSSYQYDLLLAASGHAA